MKRWKTLPWVLGVAVLAISLVAANKLLSKDDTKPTEPGANAPPAKASLPSGLTIVGTVDSDPTMLRIDPPGIVGLPALTIKKVLVKEGDIVKPGDVLIQFDDSQFLPEKLMAEKKLLAAESRVKQAELARLDYPKKLKQQKSVVDLAETKHADAVRIRDSAYATARAAKSALVPLTPEQKEDQIKNSLELIALDNSVKQAKINWDNEKNTYERLETAKIDVNGQLLNSADLDYRAALDEVEAVRAGIKKVEAIIESFKLKALVEGEIECLMASDGMTFSPTTRTMLMYLVPTGPRVIRAEVEAEFASKVNAQVGKTVTIYDNFNFNLTYTGTVRRVSSTFLPKRFGADALVANNNRVLECTIDVPNPKPAGKPPLRPGQPVRVTFGP
jgi:multidrug resistance efflux pump